MGTRDLASQILTSLLRTLQGDHVRRTFDYEPFIREFIIALENEGLLDGALNPEEKADTGDGTDTQPRPGRSTKASGKAKRR